MSAAVEIPKNTELARLDELVGRLREGARSWVKLPIGDKIAVCRRMLEGYSRVAERSVLAACAAKGITPGTPMEGEEWLAGAYVTLRILRLTAEALEAIRDGRETPIGKRVISWSFYPIAAIRSVHCYAIEITDRLNLEARKAAL